MSLELHLRIHNTGHIELVHQIGEKAERPEYFPMHNARPKRLLDKVGRLIIKMWQIAENNGLAERR